MSPPPTILIAGIGNIFLGDDAFGSEVRRRLDLRPWPEGVRVVDFGIRGLDLAYALLDGHDLTILIDATPRGGTPGTLYVIEPDLSVVDAAGQNGTLFDAHTLDPLKVLGMARVMGAMRGSGCSSSVASRKTSAAKRDDWGSPIAVRVAVDEGVEMVSRLVDDFLHGNLHTRPLVDGGQAVLANRRPKRKGRNALSRKCSGKGAARCLENSHNHDLVYLAGGLALGVGIGTGAGQSRNAGKRQDVACRTRPPKAGARTCPIGLLTLGGTLAAGAASIAPDIARYIKISSM